MYPDSSVFSFCMLDCPCAAALEFGIRAGFGATDARGAQTRPEATNGSKWPRDSEAAIADRAHGLKFRSFLAFERAARRVLPPARLLSGFFLLGTALCVLRRVWTARSKEEPTKYGSSQRCSHPFCTARARCNATLNLLNGMPTHSRNIP